MKKRLTLIAVLLFIYSTMFGQDSHWGTPVSYDNSMTVFGRILINDELQYRNDVEIAAFCGDELRGVALPENLDGDYYFFLNIAGNSGDRIKFKLYVPEFNNPNVELLWDYDYTQGHLYFVTNYDLEFDVNFVPSFWDQDNIVEYDSEMFINAYINIDGEYQNRGDLELAVFCDNELRELVRPIYNKKVKQYIATLTIMGNNNDELTFKLYDHSGNVLSESMPLNSVYVESFVEDVVIGTPIPITLNFIYQSVAKVGDQYFTTLAAAVEAATEDNNVITLLKEVTGDGFVIDKDVTIDFAGFAYTLNEGEVISIQEGGVATFVNDANITEGVELFGGQLYTTNDNLTIVAKKAFEHVTGEFGAKDGWGTISTPVGKVAIPENDNHDLYMYEEATAMWRFYTGAHDFDYFELGTGYLYANTSDITMELNGKLNIEPMTCTLGHTSDMGALAGFNFVGNPFAHNINEDNFSTTNGAVLSNGFYVISAEGAIVARPENAVISPMESVMVQTNKETELTINNVRSSKRNAEDNGRLEISVANANYSDVAYVSFNEGRGLNKIAHRNAEIPMVYVPVDGINYAVATMNQDVTEIPVSFKAATIGEYTIGAETQNCEYAIMTLVDRFTGVETNLLIEDYTFIAKSNDSAERFFIRLDNGQQSTDNSHFAYINNGMMYIYNIEGQGVVNVYDVTGRPIAEYNVAESANISTSEFAAGVYIIRMSDENGVKVQKIVVE